MRAPFKYMVMQDAHANIKIYLEVIMVIQALPGAVLLSFLSAFLVSALSMSSGESRNIIKAMMENEHEKTAAIRIKGRHSPSVASK